MSNHFQIELERAQEHGIRDKLTMADLRALAGIERALSTLPWWLVQAQTGFGERDARGIEDILNGLGIEASA